MTRQLNVRLPENLNEALRSYAKANNYTLTAVVKAALEDFLNPDEYKTASLKHLAEINSKIDVLLRRQELTSETIGRFLLVYLTHTPALPNDERPAAVAEAKRRWENFSEKIAQSLARDKTYLRAVVDASPSPISEYYDLQEDDDAS